jgi:AcrR family transcriptional regulator
MAGGGDSVKGQARTPRGELARFREAQEGKLARLRERIMEAMLEASGEHGYRDVSVQDVIDRYGGHRQQFYKHFAGKAECYAAAYELEAERRYAALGEIASAEPNWRVALRATLSELARFVCERPQLASGLLVEVHIAGGPALIKRTEVFERLTRAIDGARRETESRHSPPPVTATFMVGTIEAAVVSALAKGRPESFAAAVPELGHLVVAAYFGDDAADEDMAALKAA